MAISCRDLDCRAASSVRCDGESHIAISLLGRLFLAISLLLRQLLHGLVLCMQSVFGSCEFELTVREDARLGGEGGLFGIERELTQVGPVDMPPAFALHRCADDGVRASRVVQLAI